MLTLFEESMGSDYFYRSWICKGIKIELLSVCAMLEITNNNYHFHLKHPFPKLTELLQISFGRVPWHGRDGCEYLV